MEEVLYNSAGEAKRTFLEIMQIIYAAVNVEKINLHLVEKEYAMTTILDFLGQLFNLHLHLRLLSWKT